MTSFAKTSRPLRWMFRFDAITLEAMATRRNETNRGEHKKTQEQKKRCRSLVHGVSPADRAAPCQLAQIVLRICRGSGVCRQGGVWRFKRRQVLAASRGAGFRPGGVRYSMALGRSVADALYSDRRCRSRAEPALALAAASAWSRSAIGSSRRPVFARSIHRKHQSFRR